MNVNTSIARHRLLLFVMMIFFALTSIGRAAGKSTSADTPKKQYCTVSDNELCLSTSSPAWPSLSSSVLWAWPWPW